VIAQKQAQRSSPLSDIVKIQNTSMSIAAPNAPANKQSVPHQIVVALPLRQDGKIWPDTVTFTCRCCYYRFVHLPLLPYEVNVKVAGVNE
jgi:hypothetical protein